MKKMMKRLLPLCLVTVTAVTQASPLLTKPMNETTFVKTFSGKSSEFVRENLGEPDNIASKTNDSGKVEFWLYKDIVKMGKDDKTFKFTQIGIINNYVETLGNSNRAPH